MDFSKDGNLSHPEFEKKLGELRNKFFSRDPGYWPVFNDLQLQEIIRFRLNANPPSSKLSNYKNGSELFSLLSSLEHIPETSQTRHTTTESLLTFAAALAKDWENPASVENVVTMPSDPAIMGSIIGVVANPNLVHREYAEMACDLEQAVIRQIANLSGYNPESAAGIFTQGGTFCNLYGYLLGIRKSLPEAKHYGMSYTHDYRIINSQGGHYSNTTNLSLLGVNIRDRTIRIKLNEDNDIDIEDFKYQLESCFRLNCVVPSIMLTMGTTDTFGVDRVKPIWETRNRLCEKYNIEVKPHIHVDSAIGWSMIFFLDYDFDSNPLKINEQTLAGIKINTEKFSELKYADSYTVDFQKWGYVPYTSSLVMIKNKSDLTYMENDPENFSYFEKETQGQTHLQATIECSRGAAGVFGAFAGLNYLGKTGYQYILANCLQNANYFRWRLSQLSHVKLLSSENQGPSVAFRLYNPSMIRDADSEFHLEYVLENSDEYRERLKANNAYHREHFLNRGKHGLYTNWVKVIAHTTYDDLNRFVSIPGEKAVFMNPITTRTDIDAFIDKLTSS